MTPLELIDALAEELEELFKDWRYKCKKGDLIPINIYKQDLPKLDIDYSQDEMPVPYLIVRLIRGNDTGERNSNYVVSVCIIAGD